MKWRIFVSCLAAMSVLPITGVAASHQVATFNAPIPSRCGLLFQCPILNLLRVWVGNPRQAEPTTTSTQPTPKFPSTVNLRQAVWTRVTTRI
jgi:hypothetical protein